MIVSIFDTNDKYYAPLLTVFSIHPGMYYMPDV